MKQIAILFVMFALAACVPIQPDDPNAIEPRAKGGLEEFAYVLAKLDAQDDSSEYLELLLEFEDCILAEYEILGHDFEAEFSDEQLEVMVMYSLTVYKTTLEFLIHEELEGAGTKELEVDERQHYQGLVWAVSSCNGELDLR